LQLLFKVNARGMVQRCMHLVPRGTSRNEVETAGVELETAVAHVVQSPSWDNWVQMLAEIATYDYTYIIVTVSTCAWPLSSNNWWLHTPTYMRLHLLIMISCMRHTLCRRK